MSARLRQLRREDHKLANRLGTRHSVVREVDRALDFREHSGVDSCLRERHAGILAVVVQPHRKHLGVERDQGADERFLIADHHHLADERIRPDRVLECGRSDVLAAGRHDDLLLAAGDGQETVSVEVADVAGLEPALIIERLRGRLRVLPVLLEDVHALDLDLAVVDHPNRDTGERGADSADLRLGGEVHGRRGGRLCEAVALQDHNAEAVEEVPEVFAERCGTGDRVLDVAAHRRPQLAVDQTIEQGELDFRHEWDGLADSQGLRVLDGEVRGRTEDLALAPCFSLLLRGVVHLLEHAGNRE